MSIDKWKVGVQAVDATHVSELRHILGIVDPTWAGLPDKPATMPAAAHTHGWSEVTGKPSTYPPSSHNHAIADITGLQAALTERSTKRVEVYTGTTNENGDFVITFSPAFTASPVVLVEHPAGASQMWQRVSVSTTGATYRLNQRSAVNVLTVEVLLAATVPVSGAACRALVVGD